MSVRLVSHVHSCMHSCSGEYDALILARTGLERLGLSNRISQVLSEAEYGYAGIYTHCAPSVAIIMYMARMDDG